MLPAQQILSSLGATGTPTDPYYANVVSLLHFDGADGSTTFTDQKGKTWTARGNAQLDTAQFKYGTASLLLDGTGDSTDTPNSTDFDMGSGDFTLEGWIRPNTTAGIAYVFARVNVGGYGYTVIRNGTGLQFYASSNGSSWNIASAQAMGTVGTGAWYSWAVSRVGSNWYGFVEGVQGFTFSSSATIVTVTAVISIGAANSGTYYDGWQDEVRITKGVGRYNAGYTPSGPFPNS